VTFEQFSTWGKAQKRKKPDTTNAAEGKTAKAIRQGGEHQEVLKCPQTDASVLAPRGEK